MRATHGGDVYGLGEVIDYSSNVAPSFALVNSTDLDVGEMLTRPVICVEHYPDPLARGLRAALASRYGVCGEQIVCGNGASDLIYRIVAALKPRIGATLPCTFSEYAAALRLVGADVAYWPHSPALSILGKDSASVSTGAFHEVTLATDWDSLSQSYSSSAAAAEASASRKLAKPEVYFICNPNNPTSDLVDHATLVQLANDCEREGALLVVDECFMEFAEDPDPESMIPLLATHKNLVVLRAFTKSYALAGVRLGYALCGSPELAERIAVSGPPWSVSAVAQGLGCAALGDIGYMPRMRRWIAAERPRFLAELGKIGGLEVYPAQANFVLFRVSSSYDPQRFFDEVLTAGFLLRKCTDFPGLSQNHFRCAIKLANQNDQLLAAIRNALAICGQFTHEPKVKPKSMRSQPEVLD